MTLSLSGYVVHAVADEFQALWDGQTVNHKSPSEADYALAKILMFWCGNDKAQVERIFQSVGVR